MSRFYKMIFQSTMEGKKLRIPELFVRRFGNKISGAARVVLPDGHLWLIGISKSGKETWFQEGFDEFMDHYSIREGHLLVFAYNGDSNFHVRIFDRSACEIRYPDRVSRNSNNIERDLAYGGLQMEENGFVTESPKNAHPVEAWEGDSNKKNISCSSRKPRGRPRKAKGKDCNEKVAIRGKEVAINSASKIMTDQNWLTLNYPKTFMNPAFTVQLHEHNMIKIGGLAISFARAHLKRDATSVKVKDVSGKREWDLRILTRHKANKDVYIYSGWNQFLRDNELKVGDVCGFELMEAEGQGGIVLQFTKVHSAEDAGPLC